jgi:GDP/UDP-N,N'-diacetylbacillosamine 2-epimerase (hydrolysing)
VRRICVLTGTRAEYGLLRPLLKRLRVARSCQLQIIATGTHLSPEFGLTFREIQRDGYRIDERVEMLVSADTETAITKSIGLGVMGLGDALARLRPDILVLLGDRYETFAGAVAATVSGIPIAHIHGGELTLGAIDDSFRHAITKMAHLHFTATGEYRRRVVQLGEDPASVYNVGALGAENILSLPLLARREVDLGIGFSLKSPTVLVTYHPVTRGHDTSARGFRNMLKAFEAMAGLRVLFTMPNADTHGRVIMNLIKDFVERHPDTSAARTSLGAQLYLSTMKHAAAVVGNSSSGIIEAPVLGVPSVNVGARQDGRARTPSIIDCPERKAAMVRALTHAVSPAFRRQAAKTAHPYGDGSTSKQIMAILGSADMGALLAHKVFHDIPVTEKE